MEGKLLVKFFCVVCAVLIHTSKGEMLRVGELFDTYETQTTNAQGVFLLTDEPLQKGVILNITCMVIKALPVSIQVWRPYEPTRGSYQFIKEFKFVPRRGSSIYDIGLKPSDSIFVEQGDRLAIFNGGNEGALGWKFGNILTKTVNLATVDPNTAFARGKLQTFESLGLPYEYSFYVLYDTDSSRYSPVDAYGDRTVITDRPIPPPTPYPFVSGAFEYSGTDLLPRNSFMTTGSGSCLLSHKPLTAGVVTAFYTYAVQMQPLVFQIWRPVPGLGPDFFRLAGEFDFIPLSTGYIEAKLGEDDYIFVQDDDRLGFLFMDGSRAVGYNFDPSMISEIQPKCTSFPDDDEIFVGQNVLFNSIGVPYDFAIGVVLDTVLDVDKYGVPTPLPVITTRAPSDKQAGLIDLNLPPEEEMLPSDFSTTSNFLPQGAARSWVNTDLAVPVEADVVSFWAWLVHPGTVTFQLWRPDPLKSGNFKLLGSKKYTANSDGLHGVRLGRRERMRVQPGDILGFANEEERSVIGHHFEAVPLLYAESAINAQTGDSVTFDSLLFPYKFAYALTYVPVGRGGPGPGTASGSTSNDDDDDWLTWVEGRGFVFALFLWLIVLSLLFLILCCYVILKRKRWQENNTGYTRYSYGDTTRTPSFNTPENTLETKKSDSTEPPTTRAVAVDPAVTALSGKGSASVKRTDSQASSARLYKEHKEPMKSGETMAYVNPVINTPPRGRKYNTTPRTAEPRSAGPVASVYVDYNAPSAVNNNIYSTVNRNPDPVQGTHF